MHRSNSGWQAVTRFLHTKTNLLHLERKIHLFGIKIVALCRLGTCMTHQEGKRNDAHSRRRHESSTGRPENVAVQFLTERGPQTLFFCCDSQSSCAKM